MTFKYRQTYNQKKTSKPKQETEVTIHHFVKIEWHVLYGLKENGTNPIK